jgi:hypothetical protein
LTFSRNKVVRQIFVNFVAVRALEISGGLMRREMICAFVGYRFSLFCGEALQTGFAFHQPG